MKKSLADLISGAFPEMLEQLIMPREISEQGSCATSTNPDLWHSDEIGEINEARLICDSCPVVKECLAWALYTEEHGVWGGKTPGQRKKLRNGKSLFTLAERLEAVEFRTDIKTKNAVQFASKWNCTERKYYRYQALLGVEDQAS